MTRRTLAWVALLPLLVSVLALLLWWGGSGPAAPDLRSGGLSAPDRRAARSSAGHTSGPALQSANSHDTEKGAHERKPSRELPRPSAGVCAHLVVRARCEGELAIFESARAYALRAGSSGAAGTYEVPNGVLKLDGEPVRIPLLHPGRYDVGVVTDWGYAMAQDVEVATGEAVEVELLLSEPGVVQVRLLDPWPIPDLRHVRAWLKLDPRDAWPGRSAPGRGEAYQPARASSLWTELQGVCLPTGVPYRAHVRLVEPAVMYATSVLSLQPGTENLILKPADVRAGDQVQLGLPQLRKIPVRFRFPAEWPRDARSTLKVEAKGRKWISTYAWYRELDADGFRKSDEEDVRLLVPEGPSWELHWSGNRLASGSRRFDEQSLGAGGAIEVPLVVRTAADGEPLRVRVDLGRPAARAYVSAFQREPGSKPRKRAFPASGELEVPRIWRGETFALAHTSDGRISRTVPMPATGPLELPWIQGGFVRVKGADDFPDQAAALVCRRSDGEPFLDGGALTSESYIEEDDLLGPFLPGSVEFEVWAGRTLLRRMTVAVRPGEESVLRLP